MAVQASEKFRQKPAIATPAPTSSYPGYPMPGLAQHPPVPGSSATSARMYLASLSFPYTSARLVYFAHFLWSLFQHNPSTNWQLLVDP